MVSAAPRRRTTSVDHGRPSLIGSRRRRNFDRPRPWRKSIPRTDRPAHPGASRWRVPRSMPADHLHKGKKHSVVSVMFNLQAYIRVSKKTSVTDSRGNGYLPRHDKQPVPGFDSKQAGLLQLTVIVKNRLTACVLRMSVLDLLPRDLTCHHVTTPGHLRNAIITKNTTAWLFYLTV